MYKLVIDIGTTTAKCVLFAEGIRAVAEASVEYSPKFSNGNWVQQSADDWWSAALSCIQSVLKQNRIDPKEIHAIGISGQTPTFLLLDESGVPVYDSIIWMDRRSEAECGEIAEKISPQKIFEITGNQLDAYYLPSKFVWFKKHYPELYAKAKHIITSNGYINYKLTGKLSFDRTCASTSLLFDIHNNCWSQEILQVLDIQQDLFPPLFDSTDIIGHVSSKAALITGLAEGTPVIAGTADAFAASVEAGVTTGGKAFEATGTSSVFSVAFDSVFTTPYLSAAIGMQASIGALFGPMSTSGASYKWCRDVLFGGENSEGTAYHEMNKMICDEASEPTNIIFLPYMAGERSPIWNSEARGVFFGISLGTKQAHLMRAVMEGTSFALRDNIETAKKAGVTISSIRSVGGCCNSETWLKIKASIINLPIEIPKVRFGAPAGLALMTMPITGEYATVQDAVDACIEVEKTVFPVDEWVGHYDKMFRSFKNIYEHTINDFTDLSKL